ncbi:MAG TPA: hypothetical protein PK340_00535 [Bacilli bacterium]|nr:hypothetical protein [Bacilli bacterium]
MNYQRNYLYFKNPRKYNFWWLLLFLLIAGGAIYASFSGMLTPTYLGYVLGGILLLLGVSFGAFFPLRCRIKDSYIDKQVRDGVVMFEKLALDQLKITPLKSDVLQTVRYYSFTESTKYKDIEILSREGDDEKKRTSHIRLISYFFTESKFIAYHYEFSLIKPWLAEGYTNYYYSEMSTKEVHEVNTENNPYLQTVEIINK